MTAFRRDPFGTFVNEFNRVQEEFDRLFGLRTATDGTGLRINLWQDDNAVYAELDLPAVDPAKLDIQVTEGNRLSVQGERPAPEVTGAVWVRQERPFGTFSRAVVLPALVDPDKVEATYEHGVLKLTMPKSEAAKPRKICVRT
jgi:HSP20 family protein